MQSWSDTRDAAYREGATYLQSLGIVGGRMEITRVLDIAMNPNSLFTDGQKGGRHSNASVSCSWPGASAPMHEILKIHIYVYTYNTQAGAYQYLSIWCRRIMLRAFRHA